LEILVLKRGSEIFIIKLEIMEQSKFEQIVEEQLKLGRPKIAFGIKESNSVIEESLRRGEKYADLVLVSKQEIPGFKTVVSENPEYKIIDMLLDGEVDGIVRGTIDDFGAFYHYCKKTGFIKNKVINPGLMETPEVDTPSGKKKYQFFISPGSNPEGWEVEEKIYLTEGIAEFMRTLGWEPKIGFFTSVRPGSIGKNPKMDQTWHDAEKCVQYFKEKGYNAINYNIESNTAIEDGANLIVPANGMIGNQMFRMVLVSGGKCIICPRINLPHIYEDTSRTEKDFEWHIKYAAAWANSKK